jgi:hypothetical protein
MWTCANCRESNADEADICEVCGRPRQAPVAPAEHRRPALSQPVPDPEPFPEPAHTAPATHPPRRPRRSRRPLLVVALLTVAAAISVPLLLRGGETPVADPLPTAEPPAATTPAPDPTYTGEPGPTDTAEPTPEDTVPTAVGIARIGTGVTDSRAADIAAMFDTYFAGINNKDYNSVATVLDPAGTIDPGSSADMASLARGTRTTQDSDIELAALADLGGNGLRADVTFRSEQASGDGPKGRTSETCTRWHISYTVSFSDRYRVVRGKASSRPC